MKGMRLITIAMVATTATMSVLTCSDDVAPPLIFAAASLVDVMEETAEQYEEATGEEVRFSFGGSNLLANQITAGAKADAVIVAGKTPVSKLVNSGDAGEGDEIGIFTNRLVAVQPSGSTSSHATPQALVGAGRIAMPDPATAPAGEYFQNALKESGLWDELESQIVPTLDVRAALAAAASGNVAYAFVYETDAISTDGVEIVFVFENVSDASIPRYYALPLVDEQPTNRFIRYLSSPEATTIFEKYGFSR